MIHHFSGFHPQKRPYAGFAFDSIRFENEFVNSIFSDFDSTSTSLAHPNFDSTSTSRFFQNPPSIRLRLRWLAPTSIRLRLRCNHGCQLRFDFDFAGSDFDSMPRIESKANPVVFHEKGDLRSQLLQFVGSSITLADVFQMSPESLAVQGAAGTISHCAAQYMDSRGVFTLVPILHTVVDCGGARK